MGIEDHDLSHRSSERCETRIAWLSYHEDVLLIVVKDDSMVAVEDMEELLQASVKLAGYGNYYSIVDVRVNAGATQGVTDYYAKNDYNRYRYADAFIINTLAMRLLVNFYVAFNKPSVPTKTFADPESAAKWISSLKQKRVQQ